MKEKKKLSAGRILAFAVGDICGGGVFNIVNFLYPAYLAVAIGLKPYYAGIIIMLARVFDAVIDPPIGFLSDKMRVRYGSRRRTMLISAPLLVVAMFLMFYPHDIAMDDFPKFLLALGSYLLFCLVQSTIMIPYFSLASEITEDYTERARLTSVRLGFSIFSSIICVAVPGIIVDAFKDNKEAFGGNAGYVVMSILFGVIFMVSMLITALFAKEDVPAPKSVDPFVIKDLIKPFKLKPFRQYLWIYLCCQMTMAIMSALFFFYVDYYFCRDLTAQGEGNIVGMLGAAIMFGMQIVALPIYMKMIRKFSKMAAYISGAVIWIVSALLLLVLPAGVNPVWLYILAAVMGFGISGPGLIPHAIFGDVVDAGHLKFGERDAGSFSGIGNFINTVAQALGIAAAMFILGAAGFQERKASMDFIESQAPSAQTAIILVMALAPLICMTFAIFVCTRYRLNMENHARVLDAIENGSDAEKAKVLESL